MDQTTTFSPHLYVRLLDDRLVPFARSTMNHWADLCEQLRADRVAGALKDIDDIPAEELKPIARANARSDAADLLIPVGYAVGLCRESPKWILKHLLAAAIEAGATKAQAEEYISLIPWQLQHQVADTIAMVPFVKSVKEGNPAIPTTAGGTSEAAASGDIESTGVTPAPSSNATATESTSVE